MSGQSSGGKLVAMGDVTGTVSLLEVCESLAAPQANERKAIDMMFEREMKQEKNLEVTNSSFAYLHFVHIQLSSL